MSDVFYPVLTMNLLVVAGAWCVAKPSRPAALRLAALAVAWAFGNGPLEGNVLWTLNRGHGLTVSDLLSAAAMVVAAWTWRRTSDRDRRK
ncbi:hypothetical protein [Prescottella equi]|uniref:hypothetical protein n=1 Tax=Rhodococcus hoagii TaxID=43767 RepID=UPI000A0FF7D2|nr:hypothetical protein [Prescottella equi]ORJ98559.1 hypothetical protein A6F58_05510 [Prescottella equi]